MWFWKFFFVIFFKKDNYNSKKPVLSQLYKKRFGVIPKIALEEISYGFLKNVLECIFEKIIVGKIIIGNEVSYSFNISDGINIKETTFCYEDIKKKEITSVLKKVMVNNHLVNNNGEIKLWGVSAIFIPFHFLISLTKFLDNDRYSIFFKSLGRMQGKCAVDIQEKKFGITKKNLFFEIVKQSNLIGMGVFILKKKSPIKFSISNNLDSFYFNFYRKKDYFLIQQYFLYDIKGIYDTIEEINSLLIEKEKEYRFTSTVKNVLSKEEEFLDKHIGITSLF